MKTGTSVIQLLIVCIVMCFFISADLNGQSEKNLPEYLGAKAHELISADALNPLIEEAGERRLVLLGESTHGTSEYYIWRGKISRRLLEESEFDFIVVEGDWPSFYQINLYVKGIDHQDKSAVELLREHFNRWPPWMWANQETADLIEWLREFNRNRPDGEKAGIYGMDVYSKKESIEQVRRYLKGQDSNEFAEMANLYDCFTRYGYDGGNYARALNAGAADCSEEVFTVVDFLRQKRELLIEQCIDSYFNAKQNALIVKNAEKHYRSAISRGPDSWNHRVRHMELTVNRLLDHYGQDSQGIVWAHNTHIGDARATPMYNQGSFNIGQLSREHHGREEIFSVGFGCYRGRVLAGSSWGSAMMTMDVPEAGATSIEEIMQQVPMSDYFLVFDDEDRQHALLNELRGHRAIGVVYNPQQEYPGNYVPTILTGRYDAFFFFEETKPLEYLD